MNILTIIGGLNGAGKSSLTGVLKTERDDLGVVINVNEIAKERHISGLEAGKIALNKIDECLTGGVNLTWETTLSGRTPQRIAKKAKSLNYFIKLYYVGISEYEELLRRIANRVSKGGHNIPKDALLYRYKKFISDLCAVLPYCSEAFLYDNENGFVQIAYLKNGKLYKTVETLPEWALKVFNEFNGM